MTRWTYTGDVNIEYGGQYLNLEEYKKYGDFCPVVRVTDLDSATGFEGAVMIEVGSVYVPKDDNKRMRAILEVCDYEVETANDLEIVEACLAYGGLDDCEITIIQTLDSGKMEFDGWKADSRLLGNLREYVETFLS